MKILHTADWHLGKRLDHIPRLAEQAVVLNEICEIADREEVDLVIIAGDLFDHINPSIEALELFYRTLKRLANDGKRAVVGIAGNHDSPDRIEAPVPLAQECGIILLGYPHSKVRSFSLETGLKITQTDHGFVEFLLPEVPYPIRLILTPYANEIRLKKYLGHEKKEENLRQVLKKHWQDLADKYFDEQGINLLMTHLFMMKSGGEKPEEPEDEKPILTVGGAQEVYTENLPKNLQYVALGHLHRKQFLQKEPFPVAYSSSPLAYSMSEAEQDKFVIVLEVNPGGKAECREIKLTKGKKLYRKTFFDISDAVDWLEGHPDSLVELTIVSDDYLTAPQRKELHDAHTGIVSIIPQITDPSLTDFQTIDVDLSKDIQSLFVDYFQHKHGQAPNERILDILKEVLAENPQ